MVEITSDSLANYIKRIETENGHDTRETIILGLSIINDGGMNATTFNGKTEKEYLKDADMRLRIQTLMSKIKKDNKPSTKSDNLITTKGIRSVIGPIPYLQ